MEKKDSNPVAQEKEKTWSSSMRKKRVKTVGNTSIQNSRSNLLQEPWEQYEDKTLLKKYEGNAGMVGV